ncbi:hypothetical protein CEXT_92321 [Caerostris extrusa]|uniref:Uncharacterized protein n=1 Tax=Caerostris extrusa TaxID=172846 RepID=A0AAV4NG21_CAEEX|nr:hypothetical protein CEXT_92321 [Caerostris extrusa]
MPVVWEGFILTVNSIERYFFLKRSVVQPINHISLALLESLIWTSADVTKLVDSAQIMMSRYQVIWRSTIATRIDLPTYRCHTPTCQFSLLKRSEARLRIQPCFILSSTYSRGSSRTQLQMEASVMISQRQSS